MTDPKPPELRAKDEDGNTRPADDRWLTAAQKKKRDAYVDRVTDTSAELEQPADIKEGAKA